MVGNLRKYQWLKAVTGLECKWSGPIEWVGHDWRWLCCCWSSILIECGSVGDKLTRLEWGRSANGGKWGGVQSGHIRWEWRSEMMRWIDLSLAPVIAPIIVGLTPSCDARTTTSRISFDHGRPRMVLQPHNSIKRGNSLKIQCVLVVPTHHILLIAALRKKTRALRWWTPSEVGGL